jgi:capsular exopolysaccharide synthesis family protein
MAQSGRKVLLIDADMRKPRIHKLIRIETVTNGLAAVIDRRALLAEATRPSGIMNLTVLCCGDRPANPAELLTSPNFPSVIEEARKLYDIVIIDTPPLLAVSDPCVVAARVDGVILTMRLRKNGRPLAERARDILSALDAKVLGVVINGNDKDPAQHDGYGYGYKYGSYYSYTDYHHYTDEEGRQSPSPASRVLPMLGMRGRKGPGLPS